MDVISLEIFMAKSVCEHKNMWMCFPTRNTVPRRSELQMGPVKIARTESHMMSVFQQIGQLIMLGMFSGINGVNSQYMKSDLTIQT
jgi:hypothetical protein